MADMFPVLLTLHPKALLPLGGQQSLLWRPARLNYLLAQRASSREVATWQPLLFDIIESLLGQGRCRCCRSKSGAFARS